MTNEEAISLFEETLRKLKIQYDLFFAGVRKLPPTEDRRRLENLVRDLGKSRMRDNASRFRYNTLLGRYNQFQELWQRQMREREEGPMDYRRRAQALAQAGGAETEGRDPQASAGRAVTNDGSEPYVRVTATSTEDAAKALYAKISEAQKTLGKGGLSLGQVEQIVRSQTEMMQSRYAVKEVGFRVEIVDGKVKLKAKPLPK